MDNLFLLWAKASSTIDQYHPLICHMIDVGQVALKMWQMCLPGRTREFYRQAFGLEEEIASRLLAFLASLHDLGKAGPGFQSKVHKYTVAQKAAGFDFPNVFGSPNYHGVLSTWALRSIFVELIGISKSDARQIALALGGHHGSWPTSDQLMPASLTIADKGGPAWDAARYNLVQAMIDIYQPLKEIHLVKDLSFKNAFLAGFSGFVSAADWIGSMDEYFPYADPPVDLQDYAAQSANQAERALDSLGWIGWQPEGKTIPFHHIFPFDPLEIQKQAIQASAGLTSPFMIILEAPTGIGKTETALYLADTWLQTNHGRGMYIAMPTQATSNQMYSRVKHYLECRFPQDLVNLHLVHGGALLDEGERRSVPNAIMDEDSLSNAGRVRAENWFLPRKRTLLAPFGVGTVDQAFLSVLQTRHFFVRLFGLGQKVVVFDEVHAYDTYMSELFYRLLSWLKVMDTSVILLSATLPKITRQSMVAAWLGESGLELPATPYPRLTAVSPAGVKVTPLPAPASRDIYMERLKYEPQTIVSTLKDELKEGGCAAVICNRIARAQEIYAALKEAQILPPENLTLFHARYPFAWRQEIEKTVINRYCKGGDRPFKAIVVATQVIEQSLDLDFDLMVSDLAPIDLLLQRAGRLHRHAKNDSTRPTVLKKARLLLANPPVSSGLPDFGSDQFVYDRDILLRTWHTLKARDHIVLPEDTDPLIEAIYGEKLDLSGTEPFVQQEIQQAKWRSIQKQRDEISQAKSRLVKKPDDEDLLYSINLNLEEEDSKVHQAFKALTRLSEPGVSLVCLYRGLDDQLRSEPDSTSLVIQIEKPPDRNLTREFLRRSVSVQRKAIVNYFSNQEKPASWKENAALQHHYLAIFDDQGRCPLLNTKYTLVLDREYGLMIQEEA